MKIITTLLFLLIFELLYSQSITQQTYFKVNEEKKDTSLRKNYIDFTNSEINLVLENLILSQDSNLNRGKYGEIIPNYYFSKNERKERENSVKIDNEEFYLKIFHSIKDSNNTIFKKDSVLLEYWKNFEKTNLEYWSYKQKGINTTNEYSYFPYAFYGFSSIEKWQFSNSKFNKETLINSINVYGKKENKSGGRDEYLSIEPKSENYILLKKNVIYTHIIFNKYYYYLNYQDSLLDYFELNNTLDLGLKQSSGISEKEFNNFLQPIITAVYDSSISIYYLDSNGNKTNKKMNFYSFSNLFEIKEEAIIEPLIDTLEFSNDGQAIYSTTSSQLISSRDIIGFEFYEDWLIGNDSFHIKKKVHGLILIYTIWDSKTKKMVVKKIPAYISFE